jgi:hypothetical protein
MSESAFFELLGANVAANLVEKIGGRVEHVGDVVGRRGGGAMDDAAEQRGPEAFGMEGGERGDGPEPGQHVQLAEVAAALERRIAPRHIASHRIVVVAEHEYLLVVQRRPARRQHARAHPQPASPTPLNRASLIYTHTHTLSTYASPIDIFSSSIAPISNISASIIINFYMYVKKKTDCFFGRARNSLFIFSKSVITSAEGLSNLV